MTESRFNYGDAFRKEAGRRDRLGEDYGVTARAMDAEVRLGPEQLAKNSQALAELFRVVEKHQYEIANLMRDRATAVEAAMRAKPEPSPRPADHTEPLCTCDSPKDNGSCLCSVCDSFVCNTCAFDCPPNKRAHGYIYPKPNVEKPTTNEPAKSSSPSGSWIRCSECGEASEVRACLSCGCPICTECARDGLCVDCSTEHGW